MEEVNYEGCIPVCSKCNSSKLNIETPEDRYDNYFKVTCEECKWKGYIYDES